MNDETELRSCIKQSIEQASDSYQISKCFINAEISNQVMCYNFLAISYISTLYYFINLII